MSTAVMWIRDHLPVIASDEVPEAVAWQGKDGIDRFVAVDYLVERFGATIESALHEKSDVVDAIIAMETDEGWKNIWLLWRQYGWV